MNMQKYILILFTSFLSFGSFGQSKADYRQKFTEGNYLILEGNYVQALKNFLEAYQIDSSSSNINYKVGLLARASNYARLIGINLNSLL